MPTRFVALLLAGTAIASSLWAAEPPKTDTPPAEEEKATAPKGRPLLGVTIERVSSTWGGKGLVVQAVIEGSTAEDMGLKRGDRILAIGETAISTTQDLKKAVDLIGVGNPITVKIARGNQEEEKELSFDGTVKSVPVQMSQVQRLGEIKRLQRERERELLEIQAKLAGQGNPDLATSMQLLAETLQQLPVQLDETATEFKKTYPDGVFSVRIEIDIRTNVKDDEAIDVSPEALVPEKAEPEADESTDDKQEEETKDSPEAEESEEAVGPEDKKQE